MTKVDLILKFAERFFALSKVAVPLESFDIAPDWQPGFGIPIPEIKSFQRHYANTTINYRIVYIDSIFDPGNSAFKTYVDDDYYLSSSSGLPLSSFKEKLLKLQDQHASELTEKELKSVQYLLDNFNSLFREDSINIIANRYLKDEDLTGPLAVDHDLGHKIVEKVSHSMRDDFIEGNIGTAFMKDYEANPVDPKSGELLPDSRNLLSELINFNDYNNYSSFGEILSFLITKNNPLPGSISEMNLAKDEAIDLLPDLLAYYNSRGETLSGLKIEGIPFFAVVVDRNVLSRTVTNIKVQSKMPRLVESPHAKETIYLFKPKSNRLPHLESEIKEYLSKVQFGIKSELTGSVGKVISLW